jgi:GNAT superfamily N-acetyltransferase
VLKTVDYGAELRSRFTPHTFKGYNIELVSFAENVDRLCEIMYEGFTSADRDVLLDGGKVNLNVDAFSELDRAGRLLVMVALKGSTICGFHNMILVFKDLLASEFAASGFGLYMKPEHRNNGVGLHMLRVLDDFCVGLGVQRREYAKHKNFKADALFESMGCTPVSTIFVKRFGIFTL